MRFFFLISFLTLLLNTHSFAENNSTNQTTWRTYPTELPQFDYSGDKLHQYWPLLSSAIRLPWPDSDFIKDMMIRFPKLANQLTELAKKENAPLALKKTLNNDFDDLALAIQQVWRLHYQGEYEEAYKQGLKLGPAGLAPALYSKLIYITHLVSDLQQKEILLLEVDQVIKQIIPYADNYAFIIFGDAYQKARRLEIMTTPAATASGLIGTTRDTLRELKTTSPDNPLYGAMLAGIDAGIIERVGNFVGNMTYGTDEDAAVTLFKNAITTYPHLAVLYNEFAQLILRLDNSDYDNLLLETLRSCDNLTVYSAEEALNQLSCRNYLQQIDNK